VHQYDDDRPFGAFGAFRGLIGLVEPAEVAASVRHVRVRFERPPVLLPPAVLADVDLDVVRGRLTALAGPNGAGKTTLLRVLAGLQAPYWGVVEILGAPPAPARSRDLRRRVGYIPQDVALDPEMTGRETLTLLAALHGVPRRERAGRVAALAAAFGTEEHLPRIVSTWSGGLKRRLHLASGMIHDPDLLLFDEPTAGLDQQGCDALWAELERRAAAGRAVVVVTHDLAAVERHADFVAILDHGRIAAFGSPAGLIAEHGAEDLAEVHRRLTGRKPEPPRSARPRPSRRDE
jgi:ABC-2 type transport system ATP-binding protein